MLKDRSQWQPGWTPLNELAVVDEAETLDDGTLQILPTSDKENGLRTEGKEDGDENSAGKDAGKNAAEQEPAGETETETETETNTEIVNS